MSELLGLPPLPPCDARRVSVALNTACATLANCRDVMTAADDMAHTQWALTLEAHIDDLRGLQTLLVVPAPAGEWRTESKG